MVTEKRLIELFGIKYGKSTRSDKKIYYSFNVVIGHHFLQKALTSLYRSYDNDNGISLNEELTYYSWMLNESFSIAMPVELFGPVSVMTRDSYQFYTKSLFGGDINNKIFINMNKRYSSECLFENMEDCIKDCSMTNNSHRMAITINNKLQDFNEVQISIRKAFETIENFYIIMRCIDKAIIHPESRRRLTCYYPYLTAITSGGIRL